MNPDNIWRGEAGETWEPDLSNVQGIVEAVRILGKPAVEELMKGRGTDSDFVITDVDTERGTVTIGKKLY